MSSNADDPLCFDVASIKDQRDIEGSSDVIVVSAPPNEETQGGK